MNSNWRHVAIMPGGGMPETLRATPMRVAMSSSIAMHVVLAGMLLWHISRTTSPSLTQRVTVFTLATAAADDPVEQDGEDAPAPHQAGGSPALPDRQPDNLPTAELNERPAASAAQKPAGNFEATVPPAETRGSQIPAAPRPGVSLSGAGEADVSAETVSSPFSSSQLPVTEEQPIEVDPSAEDISTTEILVTAAESSASVPVARQVPGESLGGGEHAVAALAPAPAHVTRKVEEQVTRLLSDGRLPSEFSWRHRGTAYHARVVVHPPQSDMDLAQAAVEITARRDGALATTRMTLKQMAFSSFAQFINRWDPDVQMHRDELDGRFHSNSVLSLAADRHGHPAFLGKVTTASRTVRYGSFAGRLDRDRIFRGGLETGVRRIPLPARYLPFPTEAGLEDYDIHRFEKDTRIVFHASGAYSWRTTGLPEQRGQLGDRSMYMLAAPRARLFLRGTVRGKVLVYAPRAIVVEGDLRYAGQTEVTMQARDYLGLVSENTVEIAAPEITGPGDLTVHAAIYARNRFAVRRFRAPYQGTLRILGSVTAGTLSATEPRFGTLIRFDPRLDNHRPPGFPVTTRYEIADWDGAWTEVIAPMSNTACPAATTDEPCTAAVRPGRISLAGQ